MAAKENFMKYVLFPTECSDTVISFKIEFYKDSRPVGVGVILAKCIQYGALYEAWKQLLLEDTLDERMKGEVDYDEIWKKCQEMLHMICRG